MTLELDIGRPVWTWGDGRSVFAREEADGQFVRVEVDACGRVIDVVEWTLWTLQRQIRAADKFDADLHPYADDLLNDPRLPPGTPSQYHPSP